MISATTSLAFCQSLSRRDPSRECSGEVDALRVETFELILFIGGTFPCIESTPPPLLEKTKIILSEDMQDVKKRSLTPQQESQESEMTYN